MSDIPRGRKVRLIDVLSLLQNVLISKDTDTDAERTPEQIMRFLSDYQIWIDTPNIERYLYLCNMNREDQKFVDCLGRSFRELAKNVVPQGCRFNPAYNLIESKEKKIDGKDN